MRKIIIITVSSLLALIVIIGSSISIGAYNKAVKARNEITSEKAKIYTAYSGRYDKVFAFINAIESANTQINTQIGAITAARSAFADAIATNNFSDAEDQSEIIENTFINLVSYMEDNPSSWNTVGLTSGFMSEFSASTNAVTYAINNYNEKVALYNTLLQIFPNNLILGGFSSIDDYVIPEFNTTLPTFN